MFQGKKLARTIDIKELFDKSKHTVINDANEFRFMLIDIDQRKLRKKIMAKL